MNIVKRTYKCTKMYMIDLLSIFDDVIVTHPPMLQYETLAIKWISFGINIISYLKSIDCGSDSTGMM